MPFYPSLQALVGPHTPAYNESYQCGVDWSGSAWIIGQLSIGDSDGYVAEQGLFTGIELQFVDTTTSWMHVPQPQYPIVVDAIGNVWTTNNPTLLRANQSNLAQTGAFGTIFCALGSLQPVTAGPTTWIVVLGEGGSALLSNHTCLNASTGAPWTPGTINWPAGNTNGFVCAGPAGSGLAYSIVYGSAPLTFYKLDLGAQMNTAVGTIAASTIDAGWATVSISGMCLDQTDGKILVVADGSGGAHPHYLLKLDPATLAIDWQVPFPNFGGNRMMSSSQVTASTFYFLDVISGGAKCYTFNTTDGSSTSYTSGLSRVTPEIGQASNDNLKCILADMSLVNVGASDFPTLRNSTPDSFLGWGVLYVAPSDAPPVPAGPPFVCLMGPALAPGLPPPPGGIEITTESGTPLETESDIPIITEG